jgi:hypothetical protein
MNTSFDIPMQNQVIEIRSSVEPGVLLHQAISVGAIMKPNSNIDDFERVDVSPTTESLQIALLRMPLNKTFKAHKHILYSRDMPMAQESWIIIQGTVEVAYYDLDDTIITKMQLGPGSCTVTYRGGHNYRSVSDNTIVYELKTGPYLGVTRDKVFIEAGG